MSQQDMMIFVTGVVGRAMGGGAHGAGQIDELTRNALAAFEAHLAPKLTQTPSAPRPSPGAPQRPTAPPAQVGPETKDFNLWAGDKAFFGRHEDQYLGMKVREVDWATWLDQAARGDEQAIKALKIMAGGKVGTNPQYQRQDAQKIARAKACLELLKTYAAPADEGPPPETTPY